MNTEGRIISWPRWSLSCKIIDADDEWIKICYTEKKDKQVVKLMRIENIESIEEQ